MPSNERNGHGVFGTCRIGPKKPQGCANNPCVTFAAARRPGHLRLWRIVAFRIYCRLYRYPVAAPNVAGMSKWALLDFCASNCYTVDLLWTPYGTKEEIQKTAQRLLLLCGFYVMIRRPLSYVSIMNCYHAAKLIKVRLRGSSGITDNCKRVASDDGRNNEIQSSREATTKFRRTKHFQMWWKKM